MNELYITPYGKIQGKERWTDNGTGLFQLLQKEKCSDSETYFKKLLQDLLERVSNTSEQQDLSVLLKKIRPTQEELQQKALESPPMKGGEFITGEFLKKILLEFEDVLQQKFHQFSGSWLDFLRSCSTSWADIGKVVFHLAENKGDQIELYPFAFLATFVIRVENGSSKHLTLQDALSQFSHNPKLLQSLLSPIQNAMNESAFLRELYDSKRIFQATAFTADEAYHFLNDISIFEKACIKIHVVDLWKKKPPKAKVSIRIEDKEKSNFGINSLLQCHINVTIDGEVLSKHEIHELVKSKGNLVRLKGKWVDASFEKIQPLLEKWKKIELLSSIHGLSFIDGLRLISGVPTANIEPLNLEEQEICDIQASSEFYKKLQNLKQMSNIDMNIMPNISSKYTLRPYQNAGVQYLWKMSQYGLGVCLADDMGLGKTIQILSLISIWKQENKLNDLPVLIIVPATLLMNWEKESEKFIPDIKLKILHTKTLTSNEKNSFLTNTKEYLKQYDIVLTTYTLIGRWEKFKELEFPAIIIDEAQAIKNPEAKQSDSVRSLHAKYKIALTGTPIENNLMDLWSIFDFINPGLLYSRNYFQSFIGQLKEKGYAPLRTLVAPFILRRLKTDKKIISDLPEKQEIKEYCSLSKEQIVLYQQCLESIAIQLKELDSDDIQRKGIILSSIIKFKQICDHPALYLGNQNYKISDSGKFIYMKEIVESIVAKQEKLLVFTQFREMVEPIHSFLTSCFGCTGGMLHGKTPITERSKIVDNFQNNEEMPFLVLSLRAAGVGLNLMAANHVIHFDRWWNIAVENQATDRAFRIGQKKTVFVHKLISKGTLEEKIDATINDKAELAEAILQQGIEKNLLAMNNQELLKFLSFNA